MKPGQAERQVVYRDPRELKPDPNNARKHSPEQLLQIRRSIDEFTFTSPVLLRESDVVGAGNGRWEAALLDPPLALIPTITISDLTEDQWRAYAIADNKIGLNSTWDHETLRAELEALGEVELDLGVLGFSEQELSGIFLDQEIGENDASAEWTGMPEFDQQDRKAFRSIAVHFKDQAKVDEFARLVGQLITEKTRYLWFPEIEIETYADKRYVFDPTPEGVEARVAAAAAAVDEA